jgi:YebC/PmpR family DNA-binding regulatory protein
MGRAFEYRKARKFKRWNAMSKTFTRIGKEIAMSVKAGGALPENNTRLRIAIQNAKGAQMPKANIESAIKKASDKDNQGFEEVTYEGYGPYGVAIVVDTATDNTNRTVANVRSYFNKYNGSFGSSGSVTFMFETKAMFRIKNMDYNVEELELELIDAGLEEVEHDVEANELVLISGFNEFGSMQQALEAKGFEIVSSEIQRFPTAYKEITPEQEEAVYKLIDRLEEDEDVNTVYHNIKMIE